MKKITSVLMGCMVLAVSGYAAAGQVENAGFESMTGGVPDAWSFYTSKLAGRTNHDEYAAETDVFYEGVYSEKMLSRDGYGMIHQTIDGFSGGQRLDFWVYGHGVNDPAWQMSGAGDAVYGDVKFINSSGGTINEISAVMFDADELTDAPVLSDAGWRRSAIFSFVTPENTAQIQIKFRCFDGTNDGMGVYLDNVTLGKVLPGNPIPADGAVDQDATDVILSWEPGDDPEQPGQPNGDVTGYFVYIDQYDIASDPGEPNFLNVVPSSVSGTQYPASAPGIAYGIDQVVYWRVDQSINSSAATDPNTITGSTWSFSTISSSPGIVTQPTDTMIFEGQTAVLTVEADGIYPVTDYQWYDAGDMPVSGATLATLTFSNVTLEDAGSYYCVVTNSQGKSVASEPALIYVKAKLAQYDFENDLIDSVSGNAGTAVNIDPNAAGVVSYDMGIDGSALQLDGANYIELPQNAYPNSDMGLAHGTLVCWVKTTSVTTATLIGAYNDSLKTCYNLSIQASEGLYFYLRSESGAFTTVQVSAPGIFDGNWHQIAVTYALGTPSRVYMDGEQLGTGGGLGTAAVFAPWAYSLPLGAGDTRGDINKVFAGAIDSVVLYNYAKTEKEVLDMYNALSPVKKALCLDPYASMFDLAGPDGVGAEYADCKVDLHDFAALAGAWLDCGLYPECN
jgi:hypothetical protein